MSLKTVSRVFSESPLVTASTRAAVERAARDLNFRPNLIARELRTGGVATTVGFVVGDLLNPFYSGAAAGVVDALAAEGLTMVLAATNDDPEGEEPVVSALLERRVRALILVPSAPDHAYLDGERSLGTPIVALSRPLINAATDSVTLDNIGGAVRATEALLAAGHRRIAFLGSSTALYTHGQRAQGYRATLKRGGVTFDPALLRDDAPDIASAAQITRSLLALADPPTGIFASNNRAATGALEAIAASGRSVGLLAFDDFDLAAALGVSVIRHDPVLMGHRAVEVALERELLIDGPVRDEVLPTPLILRASHRPGWRIGG